MRKKNSASAERKSWEVNEVGISDGKEHTKVERECQRDESVKGSEGGRGRESPGDVGEIYIPHDRNNQLLTREPSFSFATLPPEEALIGPCRRTYRK